MQAAKIGGYDVLILDTAGRTTIDEQMMSEAAEIAAIAKPSETLLVADALTGQDAVETARRFHERLPLTGLVLTRMDGDGRGGAALSMRAVTGLPIKFLGVGEKLDGLDVFDAGRVAGRILGQGDIVSLVEKASEQMDAEKAERMAAKLKKLNASRRKRIAAGSGTSVQEVNKLLKMHQQMAGMMKKMRTKGGMKAMMGAASQAGMSPADLARMGGQQLPPGMGSGGLPGGLPGLGGGLPGLGGKKK